MSDSGAVYVRVQYELNGSRTFWTRQSHMAISERGRLEAISVETGQRKVLNHNVPWSITEGVELPPDVRERMEGCEVIQ